MLIASKSIWMELPTGGSDRVFAGAIALTFVILSL